MGTNHNNLPDRIVATIDSRIWLPTNLPDSFEDDLKDRFTHFNPEYRKKRNMGYSTGGEDIRIKTWDYRTDSIGTRLTLPRGGTVALRDVCHSYGVKLGWLDRRTSCPAEFPYFKVDPDHPEYELRFYQADGVETARGKQQGIIRAPTGTGKTISALALIFEAKQRALVIMRDRNLLKQWYRDVMTCLGLSKKEIGFIQSGKKYFPGRPLTLALQQTLFSRIDEYVDIFKEDPFGMVVVDECFDCSAQILMSNGMLKYISDIKVGDRVAHGGKVIRIMSRTYTGVLIKFGSSFVTPEHPISTSVGWVPVSDLTDSSTIWFDGFHKKRILNTSNLYPVYLRQHNFKHNGDCLVTDWSVYNLETENGVYVAEGFLVHNCQTLAARTFIHVIDKIPAKMRIGFSADETRRDKKEFLIYDYMGTVIHNTKREVLEELGIIHPVTIRVVESDFRADWYRDSPSEERDYSKLLQEMVNDPDRNQLIVDTLKSMFLSDKIPALVFTARREHARELAIDYLNPVGINTGVLIGSGKDAERFELDKAALLNGALHVGVGTFQAIGVGHNIPGLRAGLCATPVSKGNHQFFGQLRGRFCRTSKNTGKTEAFLYYIWDKDIFVDHIGFLEKYNPGYVQLYKNNQWISSESVGF